MRVKTRRAQGGGSLPELSKINPGRQGRDGTLLHQIIIPGCQKQGEAAGGAA